MTDLQLFYISELTMAETTRQTSISGYFTTKSPRSCSIVTLPVHNDVEDIEDTTEHEIEEVEGSSEACDGENYDVGDRDREIGNDKELTDMAESDDGNLEDLTSDADESPNHDHCDNNSAVGDNGAKNGNKSSNSCHADCCNLDKDEPYQPRLDSNKTKRQQGQNQRPFQSSWFIKYKWLT